MQGSIGCYLRTLRYLRPIQILARAKRTLYVPRIPDRPCPERRPVSRAPASWRARPPSMLGPDQFVFLNEEGRLKSSHSWDDPAHSKLWRYNLHYFDDLISGQSTRRRKWHQDLINRWIRDVPPGKGVGWEPYPISLRTVNWIKWDLAGGELPPDAIGSLAVQLRYLCRCLEWHLLGNHLLANAKALIFGGLYFHSDEAKAWWRTGRRILERELAEQVLADGGHFELSPMYHLIVLEDILDLVNISRAYGRIVPDQWINTARSMLRWATVMCHPDGQIPFFNDAAWGVAGTFEELREYAGALGIGEDDNGLARDRSVWLSSSGYARLEAEKAVLFFDAARVGPDYLPAHAHADTLSIEVSLFSRRVLVNSGTSLYGSGEERHRQRGTAAHNTVVIDGENSSEVWGGFRVGRRARVQGVHWEPTECCIAAEHDGYRWLPGHPVHHRTVRLEPHQLIVTDHLKGRRRHTAQVRWHLHPQVVITNAQVERNVYQLTVPTHEGTRRVSLKLSGPANMKSFVEETTWHPRFGYSEPNSCLVAEFEQELPVTVTTTLDWSGEGH